MSMSRHRGRRPRVPGGRPFRVEITLTEQDAALLVVAAARAELADGAYAAEAVRRFLAGEFEVVPADWSEVMAGLLRHRAEVAGLRADVAAVGRLVNQLARHVNSTGRRPPEVVLGRIGERVLAVLGRAEEQLVALEELVATARRRLG
ncbi:hypothetical protein [Amycolatopsis arida]|uniref:hypothetical protein n=1 Tax=Amycolatopsis arida TaxID=587909 RepID=UPI001065D39F|nr:hypothetical protein [Amycolatopsis arida]TDX84932.1 hypothetical protein CLV69_11716 [Amycolatopsis arida]